MSRTAHSVTHSDEQASLEHAWPEVSLGLAPHPAATHGLRGWVIREQTRGLPLLSPACRIYTLLLDATSGHLMLQQETLRVKNCFR